MQVTVLGAGTVLPAENRSASGYLLRTGGREILFDIGPGTLSRLLAAGVSYRDLDTIVITHLHVDHILDLVTLLQANNATPGWQRTAPLRLVGCKGLSAFVDQLCTVFGGIGPKTYALEITELTPGAIQLPGFTLEAALTGHTDNSLAYRITADERVWVYSGDAIETPELAQLARNADLFICECSFPDGTPTDNHLTPEAAARVAKAASVRHLLLTHLYPETGAVLVAEQAAAGFAGKISVASDGLATDLN